MPCEGYWDLPIFSACGFHVSRKWYSYASIDGDGMFAGLSFRSKDKTGKRGHSARRTFRSRDNTVLSKWKNSMVTLLDPRHRTCSETNWLSSWFLYWNCTPNFVASLEASFPDFDSLRNSSSGLDPRPDATKLRTKTVLFLCGFYLVFTVCFAWFDFLQVWRCCRLALH